MTITTPRPLAPVDPHHWQARAACRDVLEDLDLTEVDEDCTPEVLAAARALCRGCPVLQQCRAVALGVTDVAGVAGGMTEAERVAYRKRRGLRVRPVSASDVLRGVELAGDWTTTNRIQRLPRQFVEEVRILTQSGLTAIDIVETLAPAMPEGTVTVKTVAYARALVAGTRTRAES